MYTEEWTRESYKTTLDGIKLEPFSGSNRWGIVPFVYFPRIRTISHFGDALTRT